MSGALTQWGAGELVLSFFGRTTAPPDMYYLALIKTTAPTLYISGAELDEPENADYARVMISNDALSWANDSQPQIVTCVIDVLYSAAVSDWGQLNYWALCNAPTEGFNYFVGDLEEPLNVLTGDTPMIGAGDLSVSLGPFYLTDEDS
jgi:hypothetical protein